MSEERWWFFCAVVFGATAGWFVLWFVVGYVRRMAEHWREYRKQRRQQRAMAAYCNDYELRHRWCIATQGDLERAVLEAVPAWLVRDVRAMDAVPLGELGQILTGQRDLIFEVRLKWWAWLGLCWVHVLVRRRVVRAIEGRLPVGVQAQVKVR